MNIKNLLSFASFVIFVSSIALGQIFERTDTLFIPKTTVSPVIDGSAGDEVWDLMEWQPIDQIWMPWGNLEANLGQEAGLQIWEGTEDFTGNFKILWSEETNLLYFLVEIIDDEFVDGYVFPNGGYPNYDIVEIFIDEDRSGGPHVFDNTLFPGMSACPTCNAENAFSYHIAANALEDGEIQDEFVAADIAGTTWGTIRNYASHFPEFAMVKNENTYIWEFSLIVHNDTYNHSNQEASIVNLEDGKIMGLTMAYCDNDNPFENPLRRDHFFGSVEVPLSAHNSHWINADWFGVAKLVDESTTSVDQIQEEFRTRIYAANRQLHTHITSSITGPINIRVINILGSEVFRHYEVKTIGTWNGSFQIDDLRNGIYVVEIIHGNQRRAEKILVK
jgi:hypothetical protein